MAASAGACRWALALQPPYFLRATPAGAEAERGNDKLRRVFLIVSTAT
jgi:hypothetical protein